MALVNPFPPAARPPASFVNPLPALQAAAAATHPGALPGGGYGGTVGTSDAAHFHALGAAVGQAIVNHLRGVGAHSSFGPIANPNPMEPAWWLHPAGRVPPPAFTPPADLGGLVDYLRGPY